MVICTRCIVGHHYTLEAHPFNCTAFLTFLKVLQIGLRNLMYASAQPGIEDLSRLPWKPPSCCRLTSFIWLISPDSILVESSWYHGSLLKRGSKLFWRDCFAIASSAPGSFFPTSWYHHPLTKKVSWGYLLISTTVFLLCYCLYYYYVEE